MKAENLKFDKDIFCPQGTFYPLLAPVWDGIYRLEMNKILAAMIKHFNPDVKETDLEFMINDSPFCMNIDIYEVEDEYSLNSMLHIFSVLLNKFEADASIVLDNTEGDRAICYKRLKELMAIIAVNFKTADETAAEMGGIIDWDDLDERYVFSEKYDISLKTDFEIDVVGMVQFVRDIVLNMEEHIKFLIKHIVGAVYLNPAYIREGKSNDGLKSLTDETLIAVTELAYTQEHKSPDGIYYYGDFSGHSDRVSEDLPWLFCHHMIAGLCLEMMKQLYGSSEVDAFIQNS